MGQTELSLFFNKIGDEIAVLSWNYSTSRGPQHCSIIRKLHLCACDKQNSRSLGKVGAEIAVISCFPGTISTARGPQHCSIIKKLHLCACARLSSHSLGKIGAEISVHSWNYFYCQEITALFHNPETAPLRMRQTELSLSWQFRC
jgi:hypothetical protein